jgi:hypothetical protein
VGVEAETVSAYATLPSYRNSGACPGSLLLTISIVLQEALSYTSCNGLESDYSTSD